MAREFIGYWLSTGVKVGVVCMLEFLWGVIGLVGCILWDVSGWRDIGEYKCLGGCGGEEVVEGVEEFFVLLSSRGGGNPMT